MLDLSILTDALKDLLLHAFVNSPMWAPGPPPFTLGVSLYRPQNVPDEPDPTASPDCELNLFLFHLSEDKYVRNQFWSQEFVTGQPPGPRRQPVAYEPLGLDVFYLLSAHAKGSPVHEQQAMSIAVRALHEHATIRLLTPTPTGQATSEITLTMENPSSDELSRLWQALNEPMRLTAQYKASIMLLMPETGAVKQPKVLTRSVTAAPQDTDGDGIRPHLVATSRRVTVVAPDGPVSYDQTPATVAPARAGAPGQEVVIRGAAIKDSDTVFLVTHQPDGTEIEQDVTAWKVALTHPYTPPLSGGIPVRLRPPAAPGACPLPGRYTVRIGRPSEPAFRSNDVPLSIAPWVDASTGPKIAPVAGAFTCEVANVPGAGAELRLGATPMSRRPAGPPAAGEWQLAGTTLTFRAPGGLQAGEYAVRLRAADIEADPALWAQVP